MQWDAITLPAGDQSDFLVRNFGNPVNMNTHPDFGCFLYGWTLAAPAPTFGWTLYLRDPAGVGPEDIVVVDSIAAIPVTAVAPIGAQIVNATQQCKRLIEGSAAGLPMELRCTTSGKAGAGIIYLKWQWEFISQ